MRAIRYALLTLALAPAVSSAKYDPPPMPAGYDNPGKKPERLLDQIVEQLRVEMKDPYSIRDFILCPATISGPYPPYSKRGKWEPAKWYVWFAVNSKNSYGGYIGQRIASLQVQDGKLGHLWIDDQGANKIGGDLKLRLALGVVLDCERIQDTRIQRMLAG